jgi:hypothetical protein
VSDVRNRDDLADTIMEIYGDASAEQLAAALLPVVDRIANQRAAAELRAAADGLDYVEVALGGPTTWRTFSATAPTPWTRREPLHARSTSGGHTGTHEACRRGTEAHSGFTGTLSTEDQTHSHRDRGDGAVTETPTPTPTPTPDVTVDVPAEVTGWSTATSAP